MHNYYVNVEFQKY